MPNPTKGVREYQLLINYFLALDRSRGATYGQLAKKYKLDKSNIEKRVKGILNKGYYEKAKGQKLKRPAPIAEDYQHNP